jgi:cysteine synthase
MREQRKINGDYTREQAVRDYEMLQNINIDHTLELGYYDRKRIHNLKYYTWIEQQAKDLDELNAQWYDHENYWGNIHAMVPQIDALIREFNERVKNS